MIYFYNMNVPSRTMYQRRAKLTWPVGRPHSNDLLWVLEHLQLCSGGKMDEQLTKMTKKYYSQILVSIYIYIFLEIKWNKKIKITQFQQKYTLRALLSWRTKYVNHFFSKTFFFHAGQAGNSQSRSMPSKSWFIKNCCAL